MTVQLKRPRSETRAFQEIALANEDEVQEMTIQAFEGLCDNLETICPSVSTWRQEQNHTGEVAKKLTVCLAHLKTLNINI